MDTENSMDFGVCKSRLTRAFLWFAELVAWVLPTFDGYPPPLMLSCGFGLKGRLEYSRGPGAKRYRGERRAGWPRPPRGRGNFLTREKGRPVEAAPADLGEQVADGLGLEEEVELGAVLE